MAPVPGMVTRKGHQYPPDWASKTPAERGKILDDAKAKGKADDEKAKTPAPKGKASKPVGGSVKVPGLIPAPSIGGKKSAFGDSASQFEKDRQDWARNHPDNQGKDKVPTYTPPKKSIPSPKKKKPGSIPTPGSTVVRGLIG